MEGEAVKRQLLALKKELKCWESMFERKHGRKPSREDIEQSPSEIKDTYRQYQRLKTGGKKTQTESTADASGVKPNDGADSVSEIGAAENEVFGSHLNKRKTSEKAGGSGIEGKECATKTGPTWKLRKWTKGGGYTTVSGGGDGGGGGGSQHHSHGEENGEGVCNASESGSSAASKKIQSANIGVELSALTKGINIKVLHSPQKKSLRSSEVLSTVQSYRPGSSPLRPRLGHKLSNNWLQRCKPDLSTLPELEDVSHDTNQLENNGHDNGAVENGLDGLSENVRETQNTELEDVGTEHRALSNREKFDAIMSDADLLEAEEDFGSDFGEEEETEKEEKDVSMEEEEEEEEGEKDEGESRKVEEKERKEVAYKEEEEEEDDEECGGWDGRLQERPESSDYLFDPVIKQGVFTPARTHSQCDITSMQPTSFKTNDIHSRVPVASTTVQTTSVHPTIEQEEEGDVDLNLFASGWEGFDSTHQSPDVAMNTHSSFPAQNEDVTTKDAPKSAPPVSASVNVPTRHPHTRVAASNGAPVKREVQPSAHCVLPVTSTLGFLEEKESYVSVRNTKTAQTAQSQRKWKLQQTENRDESAPLYTTIASTRSKPNRGARKGKEKSSPERCVEESDKPSVSGTVSYSARKPTHNTSRSVGSKVTSQDDGGSSSSQKHLAKDVADSSYTAASPVFSSNAVSENFVRLNLKVKRFSRKPGGISGSAYKRKMWKQSQRGRGGGGGGGSFRSGGGGNRSSGSNTCFKCGKPGHWAKNCTEREGSKNLGCFAGEKVQFNEHMEYDNMDELDKQMLQKLAQESPFPSTREAGLMARGVSLEQSRQGPTRSEEGGGGGGEDDKPQDKESFVPLPPCSIRPPSPPPPMEPLFPPEDNGTVSEIPTIVMKALKKLGHQSFRPGQEETTTRILSGISTLLVQPTGSGKSLCYQLPAYLYSQRSGCITLVISPLVSLMEDQVRQFPACLKGACLHTNQTQSQRQRVMAEVAEGRVDVLLLSPEALVSGAFWSGWNKRSASRLPPVAFACIDEAHCVSEWSHNFRPSYLRVHKVLKERLGVKCVLGLTATATRTTALSVASHLSIAEENIIRGTAVPDNLRITVSCDGNRDEALLQLLQSSRMRVCDSVIIYCTRQVETERVAQLLRTSLQFLPIPQPDKQQQQEQQHEPEMSSGEDENDTSSVASSGSRAKGKSRKRGRKSGRGTASGKASKKSKLEWSVDSYHAGMSAGERKRVQLAFMAGRLRIVVATVAFGMGLNKSDVRAIIHYNVPKSFESYVQEIGRAGRDGEPSFCHVFIDKEGADLCELRRHAYSSTVDPYSIKQLVTKAFPSCQCRQIKTQSHHENTAAVDTDETTAHTLKDSQAPKPLGSPERWCSGHEVSIPIERTVKVFDTKEECIATLLCYLELHRWLEMKGIKRDTCSLKCYGGPRQLRALAQKVPAVAAATARMQEGGTSLDMQSSITFSSIEVASSMGWESYILCSELRDLQFNDRQTSSGAKHSGSSVLVEFSEPSFHLLSPGDLRPEELDYVCDYLKLRVKEQETLVVDKLHLLYSVLRSVSYESIHEFSSNEDRSETQTQLMSLINDYFEDKLDCETASQRGIPILRLPSQISPEMEAEISRDVHSLMSIHSDRNFSGRAITRIFHGIASPCFPAEVWARQRQFWRRHLSVDFNLLCQLVTQVGLQLRTQ